MTMEDFIKIINATYKLLDFFPDSDPLKYKAKEKALKVLENLTLISDASGWVSLQKEKASAELLDDIEILKNYLKLGKYQGWIGGINFLILLKEYDNIKSQITPPIGSIRHSLEVASKAKIHIEPELKVAEKTTHKTNKKEPNNESPLRADMPLQIIPPEITDSQRKISERQEKILDIIYGRGKAQVSDIIKEIPNITKRTIRRDLDELLKKAKIVRNGEWNKVFYQAS